MLLQKGAVQMKLCFVPSSKIGTPSHTSVFPPLLLFSDIPNPYSLSEECWKEAIGIDSLSAWDLGCYL